VLGPGFQEHKPTRWRTGGRWVSGELLFQKLHGGGTRSFGPHFYLLLTSEGGGKRKTGGRGKRLVLPKVGAGLLIASQWNGNLHGKGRSNGAIPPHHPPRAQEGMDERQGTE